MEHLPLPSKPTIAPLKIPFLSNDVYDGGPLASYPARHGWELSKHGNGGIITHDRKSVTQGEAASFLQTWLYFGLLEVTLGCMWTPNIRRSFIEEDQKGQKWLTSQCLQGLVAAWAGYVAEDSSGMNWKGRLSIWWKRNSRKAVSWLKSRCGMTTTAYRNEVRQQYDDFRENMKLVQSVMLFARRAESEALPTDQALALTALGMFLTTTWVRIYQSFYKKNPDELVSLEVGKDMTNMFFHSHMAKMKWCPSDISRIMGKSSSSVLWYYANMQAPRGDKDHGLCSESFCVNCQIDKSCYQPSHKDKDCKCHLVKVDSENLRQVLEGVGIPVLDFKASELGSHRTLEVLDGTDTKFVAISHVWAEGLGNQDENALQSCALTHIFDLIGKIPIRETKSRCLWIDTLCVPVYKCDSTLHNLAMQRMKDTYRSAAEVLVLDAYVQSFKVEGASPLESFSRVVNCSWMQRLWTLQEGRLAKVVYFQFEDGPLELGTIYNAIPLHSFPARAELAVSSEITMRYVASKYQTRKEVQAITNVLYEGLLATRDAVMFRAASEPSDEAFCLATIMDLDEKRIVDAQKDKRMEAFWEMIPRVPLSLVFSKAPSKLSTPGFRWAPASFCGPLPDNQHDWWAGPDHLWKKIEAVPTQSGLFVQLPGLFLQPINAGNDGWSDALNLSPNHAFQLADGRWLGVCLGELWNECHKDIAPQKCSDRLSLILEDASLGESLFQQFNKSRAITNDVPYRSHMNGVVARITQVKNSCADSGRVSEVHVNGLQHVQVVELPPDASTVFGAAVATAHMLWARLEPGLSLKKEGVVQVCIAAVKEIMLDLKVMNACRNQRREAGGDDSDDEIMYMLAGMAHAVYLAGFNSAEIVPEGCKWYID